MTTTYHHTLNYDCDELEDEFIVMDRDSRAIVSLNPAGRLVWEALGNRVTLGELDAAFREFCPNLGQDSIRKDIQGVLDALVAAGLAVIDEE